MKLGIMQPYLFPYFQQFRHIAECDLWIAFDTVRYKRRTWVNRNRILNRPCGWSYLSVPVAKHATKDAISQAPLSPGRWRDQAVLQPLRVYQHEAPHYRPTRQLVADILDEPAATIADLNVNGLRRVCGFLGIHTPIQRLSELSLDLPDAAPPGQWALLIAKALGASTYTNAPGGRSLFDPQHFQSAGIGLEFYQPVPLAYPTGTFRFEPDLSIIDTLMWIDRATLRALLPDRGFQR